MNMNAQSTPVTNRLLRVAGDSFSDVTPIRIAANSEFQNQRIRKDKNSNLEPILSNCSPNLKRTFDNSFWSNISFVQNEGGIDTRSKNLGSIDNAKKRRNLDELRATTANRSVKNSSEGENTAVCDTEISEECQLLNDSMDHVFEKVDSTSVHTEHDKTDACDLSNDCHVFEFCNSLFEKPRIAAFDDNFEVTDSMAVEVTFSNCSKKDDGKQLVDVSESDGKVLNAVNSALDAEKAQNMSDKIKERLMNNACNGSVSKCKSTGWTQLHYFNETFPEPVTNIQFHELGPFFGLPIKVKRLIEEHKGIKKLYAWQEECLNLAVVGNRCNLVYALPTSGGKTLVAEILMLREVLCCNKSVLFVLPFVSIVQEKMRGLSQFALDLGFLVEEYAAGKGVIPPRKRRRKNSILVATIEKALTVVESLLEVKRLEEIGLVVVDELHLLSENSGRGAALETLITYLLHSKVPIQIIGMSATIGNLEEVAKFLKAESYVGSFRPVELKEYVKCGSNVYEVESKSEEALTLIRTLGSNSVGADPDGIGELVLEVVPDDSVLVFCPTKKNCENVAMLLCRVLPESLKNIKAVERSGLCRALTTESNGQICPVLLKTIPFGVAYHHSGLTADERRLLEEAFRDGSLCVICCTSTLAAGVNLPARRVILRSPYIGKDFINLSKYKQMVGRAGRSGMGHDGQSYLVCQTSDCDKVGKLLRSSMDETVSKLTLEECTVFVLSAIGLNVATSRGALRELFNHTLLSVQAERLNVNIKQILDSCLSSLFKQGALKVDNSIKHDDMSVSKLDLNMTKTATKTIQKVTNDSPLAVSRLGKAAMKGNLSLQRAHQLYTDLMKAQSNLVLISTLHLLYLVTPYDAAVQIKPNYSVYFNVYMQLSSKEQHAAKIIGLTESAISRLVTGQKPKNLVEGVFNRFYVTLILNELWKQQGVWEVANLFQVPRGFVQNLMSSSSSFALNVLRFSEELDELWPVKALLSELTPRLVYCCTAELLPLMDLPAVKKGRAKQLFKAGFKDIKIIAGSCASDLTDAVDHMPLKVATQIIAAAKLLLLEKAENLKDEAEEVLDGLGENTVKV